MIARAIVREAQHCEEPLIGFALTSPKHPSLSNRSTVGAEAEPRLDPAVAAWHSDQIQRKATRVVIL
jgi:hypothetical protein